LAEGWCGAARWTHVAVNGDEPVTEFACNGFPESQTAEKFDTDDYRIMVVAEKFQTGFDQPKLYAMYVDKTLTGLAAVQTLSRLNRIHPAKDGTFVLDFVNDADEVAAAFEDYHGKTVAPPSDPNLLYDTRRALDEFGVLDAGEAGTFVRLLLAERADHGRLHAALGPAIERFDDLDSDEQDRFRDALGRFVRIYSFLSQIVSFSDTVLERDYLFAKALQAFVRADPGAAVDLTGAVELTHLRLLVQWRRGRPGRVGRVSGGGRSLLRLPTEGWCGSLMACVPAGHRGGGVAQEGSVLLEAAVSSSPSDDVRPGEEGRRGSRGHRGRPAQVVGDDRGARRAGEGARRGSVRHRPGRLPADARGRPPVAAAGLGSRGQQRHRPASGTAAGR
jgi:hypothetical protein